MKKVALLILATFSVPALFFSTPQAVAETKPVEAPVVEQTDGLLAPINKYRASKELAALKLNSALNESSQAKAEHLTANKYWAHVAPDGTEPWQFFDRAGYDYTHAGENLARCFKTGAAVVNAWIASPTHEAELTGDYKDIGLGVSHGSDGCDYVVAHFGSK